MPKVFHKLVATLTIVFTTPFVMLMGVWYIWRPKKFTQPLPEFNESLGKTDTADRQVH